MPCALFRGWLWCNDRRIEAHVTKPAKGDRNVDAGRYEMHGGRVL